MEEAQVSLSLVPGGAARRSPDRATGGVAGCEMNSFPGGESPSSFPAADHTISLRHVNITSLGQEHQRQTGREKEEFWRVRCGFALLWSTNFCLCL